MKKHLLIGLVSVLLFSVYAEASPVYTPATVPKNLHVYDSAGNTYVDLVAYDCSGGRYHISPAHPKYNIIVSIMMAAQMANKKVVARFDGCNTVPQGKVIGVYLQD